MIPEPVLTTAATKVATALAKKGGQRVSDAFLGPAEERRLLQVCREALTYAAEQVAPNLSNEEFIHLVGIFEELIGVLGVPGLPVVAANDDSAELARVWHDGLESLDYDVTTLPVGLPEFVDELSRVLPGQLRADAERHNSPLFPMLTIEYLAALQDRDELFRETMASLIPFSAALSQALEMSVQLCKDADTPYYTPHMVLALLQMPDSVAGKCLSVARSQLADIIRHQLLTYTTQLKQRHGGHFTPFLWRERDDVRRAQLFALQNSQKVVTPAALFLGMLNTSSKSMAELKAQLTEVEYERLRNATWTAARTGGFAAETPGAVFGHLSGGQS
jgi:hypothetical protein